MNKQLLFSVTKKDFEFQYMLSNRHAGGQNAQKTHTAVRCVHKISGAIGEAKDTRDQPLNKKNAFVRCVNSDAFQSWLKLEIARRMENSDYIERKVEKMLSMDNLLIEYLETE